MTSIPRRQDAARTRPGYPGLPRPAVVVAGCCLAVLAAGCGTSAGGHSASPAQAIRSAAPASAPAPASSAQLTRAELNEMAASYLAIARPANHRLDMAFDGYEDAEHESLGRARHDLRMEAATERRFDAQLLAIRFPSWIAMTARALVAANRRRITLTGHQAAAATLAGMRALNRRHNAANAAVEYQVRLIRQFLALPPPATS